MSAKKATKKKPVSKKPKSAAQKRIDADPANVKNQKPTAKNPNPKTRKAADKANAQPKAVAAVEKALGNRITKPAANTSKPGGKDAKAAARTKAANFMEETRDTDRTDAISDGIMKGLKHSLTGVKELSDSIKLGTLTTCEKTRKQLLEHSRKLAGAINSALQETTTKAKKATTAAKLKW